jgi:MFS family permease
MAKDFYLSDSTAYGIIIGSFSVGMLFGYSLAFKLIGFFKQYDGALILLFIARALFMLILGSVSTKYIGMISIFIIGLSISICNTYIRTYIQLSVESQFLGRVFGLMSGLSNILVPISFALAGVAVSSDFFPAHQIIFLLGIASCFCSLWICSKKSLIQTLLA